MSVQAVTSLFDHSVSLQFAWVMLHFLWQGVAIAGFVFILNFFGSKLSSRFRYGVAVLGLFAMLASVVATAVVLWPEPSVVRSADAAPLANGDAVVLGALSDAEIMATPFLPDASVASIPELAESVVEPTSAPASVVEFWAPIAMAVYVLGVGLMLLRIVFSAIGIGRLRIASEAAERVLTDRVGALAKQVGLKAQPALRMCERVVVPFVTGVLKPTILLPASIATGMTQAELDAVLLHELAHIRRGDLLINFLQRIVESLLFFHPAVWYVSRVISVERENCCDDIVLGKCSQKLYASALIRLAESCSGNSSDIAPIAALAATGASPSQLKRRVMRILGVRSARQFSKSSLFALLVCVAAIAASAVHLQAQPHDDGDHTEKSDDATDHPLSVILNQTGTVATFTVADNEPMSFGEMTMRVELLSDGAVEVFDIQMSDGIGKQDEAKQGNTSHNADVKDAELAYEIKKSEYMAAKRQAESAIRIEAAALAYETAKADYEASLEANKAAPGTITKSDLRAQKLAAERARLQSKLAVEEQKNARHGAMAKLAEMQRAALVLDSRKRRTEESPAEAARKAKLDGMSRLTFILRNLSANKRVSIRSTNIKRKSNRLTMTIKGANLDLEAIKAAVSSRAKVATSTQALMGSTTAVAANDHIAAVEFEIADLESALKKATLASLGEDESSAMLQSEIDSHPEVQELVREIGDKEASLAMIEATAENGRESTSFVNLKSTLPALNEKLKSLKASPRIAAEILKRKQRLARAQVSSLRTILDDKRSLLGWLKNARVGKPSKPARMLSPSVDGEASSHEATQPTQAEILNARLWSLTIEDAMLAQTYGPKHPLRVAVAKQTSALEKEQQRSSAEREKLKQTSDLYLLHANVANTHQPRAAALEKLRYKEQLKLKDIEIQLQVIGDALKGGRDPRALLMLADAELHSLLRLEEGKGSDEIGTGDTKELAAKRLNEYVRLLKEQYAASEKRIAFLSQEFAKEQKLVESAAIEMAKHRAKQTEAARHPIANRKVTLTQNPDFSPSAYDVAVQDTSDNGVEAALSNFDAQLETQMKLRKHVEDARAERDKMAAEMVELKNKVFLLEELMRRQPSGNKKSPLGERSALKEELRKLQLQEAELKKLYLANHPDRRLIQKQIDQLTDYLASETNDSKPTESPKSNSLTGSVQFEIYGDDAFTISGKEEDVERVMSVVDNNAKGKRPSPAEAAQNLRRNGNRRPEFTGPVQIEFVEGTDIYVVRGKQEDVERVTELLEKLKGGDSDDRASPKQDIEAKSTERKKATPVDQGNLRSSESRVPSVGLNRGISLDLQPSVSTVLPSEIRLNRSGFKPINVGLYQQSPESLWEVVRPAHFRSGILPSPLRFPADVEKAMMMDSIEVRIR